MSKNQFKLIREWASERGLYEKGDPNTQFVKLIEEQGELARALLKDDLPEIVDAIGDSIVVLTNLTELVNRKYYLTGKDALTIEKCIDSAYNEIKERKGSMQNGTFVKNS